MILVHAGKPKRKLVKSPQNANLPAKTFNLPPSIFSKMEVKLNGLYIIPRFQKMKSFEQIWKLTHDLEWVLWWTIQVTVGKTRIMILIQADKRFNSLKKKIKLYTYYSYK